MMEAGENKEQLLNELQFQQEKFAHEIILKLKYCYRLYESEPYPKKVLFATEEICDAVCAISYVFRCHYRQVYYYLHNELIYPEEYEKFCFSLPVARSKRYTFNFLFRVSFIFELTMYLSKEGYDYFDIARRCFVNYPDLLYFYESGGWIRVKEISAYILCVTKICEVDITVEHPLLGTFIETPQFSTPDSDCLPEEFAHMKYYLQETIEIQHMFETGLEQEFFNPKDMQTLTVLHKHFVASRTPKSKYKIEDLIKFHETFPLTNRVPFQIDKESNINYYIIYDFYVEKKEIIYYLRSYMDPEILEKFFPLKTSPDSPGEMNYKEQKLGSIPECFACNFPHGRMDDALDKLNSLPHECNKKMEYSNASYEENLRDIPEYFDSDTSNDLVSHECDNIKMLGNLDAETARNTKSTNECTQLLDEDTSQIFQPIYTNTKDLDNKIVHDPENIDIDGYTQSSYKEIPMSNIPDMPREKKLHLIKLIMDITKMPVERKKFLIHILPTIQCLKCFDKSLLKSICESVQHSPHSEFSPSNLKDILKNVSYISTATKHVLFKVIRNCKEFSTEERAELFQLLMNIPDNIVAEKANIVQIINNMSGCSDRVKFELIQCIIDLTDEECDELRHSYDTVKTVNSFEDIFQNVNEASKEFEQFQILCKNESKLKYDELQEHAVPLLATKSSKKMGVESRKEKQIDPRTGSMPELYQKKNKSLKNETQDDYKFCEKDNIASGTSVSSSPKLLDNCYHKSQVPNPPPNHQRYKRTKKSKKKSKK